MKKKYKKIDFLPGCSIYTAIITLHSYHQNGELVYGVFNEQELYSDLDDLDSAYKKITGKTKSEFDEAQKESDNAYRLEKKKHEDSIPELTKEWIKKGEEILDHKYHKKWRECVPVRLGDLYRGMELGACLEIVQQLNKGCDMKIAKAIIDGQGHSGMSFGLVCSMVKAFSDRGEEFVNKVR